jgi:hypothetical protein
LSDGHTYEVRHTVDAGFKAKRAGRVLWTDGNLTLVGALEEAYEGALDPEAEQGIRDAASRMMEFDFTNIPHNHRG